MSTMSSAAATTGSLSAAVAAAAVAVVSGKAISGALGLPGLHLMAMAVVAMGIASLATWVQQQQQQQQQQQADKQQQKRLAGSPDPASYFTGKQTKRVLTLHSRTSRGCAVKVTGLVPCLHSLLCLLHCCTFTGHCRIC
jgi:uncharacterized protein HemX